MARKRFNANEIMRALEGEVTNDLRFLAQRVTAAVVLATPIGRPSEWLNPPPPNYVPGEARGGWRSSLGGPRDEYDGRQDASGAVTIAAAEADIARWRPYRQAFYLNNAVPHIVPLDDGTASPQVSQGFVGRAVLQGLGAGLANTRRIIP